jgi:hypothetical protein
MRWCLMVCSALILSWIGVAVVRLWLNQRDFRLIAETLPMAREYRQQQQVAFFEAASLRVVKSLGPLLRVPWRSDVRLYFAHEPALLSHGEDAYAIKTDDGGWFLNIFM